MARAKLREYVFTSIPAKDIVGARGSLKEKIRFVARERISSYVESEELRTASIRDLEAEDLEDIFASVH